MTELESLAAAILRCRHLIGGKQAVLFLDEENAPQLREQASGGGTVLAVIYAEGKRSRAKGAGRKSQGTGADRQRRYRERQEKEQREAQASELLVRELAAILGAKKGRKVAVELNGAPDPVKAVAAHVAALKTAQEAKTGPGSSVPERQWWEWLEVSSSAPPAEIKAAYRRKVRLYHPDVVNTLGPELHDLATEILKRINQAYGSAPK